MYVYIYVCVCVCVCVIDLKIIIDMLRLCFPNTLVSSYASIEIVMYHELIGSSTKVGTK